MRPSAAGAAGPQALVVTRVIAEPRPRGWTCALESPLVQAPVEAGAPVYFLGWMLNREKPATDLRLVRERDGKELAQLQVGLDRPGVALAHPKIKHAATSGFAGSVVLDEPGSYRIEVVGDGESRTPIFTVALRDPSRPPTKLMFMHIAKTAGSSVNRFFADNVGAAQCAFHLEVDPRWRNPAGRMELAGKAVISGHITLAALTRRMEGADYVKATLLRNPMEQLISHLAFIRRLMEPSQRERFVGHAPAIQKFAAKLANTDFNDRKGVRALVAGLAPEELGLVDNLHVRYLSQVKAGDRVQSGDLDHAKHALHEFDVIGFTDRMEAFLGSVAARMNWPEPVYIPEENRNPDRYGLDPTSPILRVAFRPLIEFDELLYRYAYKVFVEGNDRPRRRLRKKARAALAAAEASQSDARSKAG